MSIQLRDILSHRELENPQGVLLDDALGVEDDIVEHPDSLIAFELGAQLLAFVIGDHLDDHIRRLPEFPDHIGPVSLFPDVRRHLYIHAQKDVRDNGRLVDRIEHAHVGRRQKGAAGIP